jgi:hypothetical protein
MLAKAITAAESGGGYAEMRLGAKENRESDWASSDGSDGSISRRGRNAALGSGVEQTRSELIANR